MGDLRRWAPPVVAAALLVLGVHLLTWFVVEEGVARLRVGPGGGELCLAGACRGVDAGSGTYRLLVWALRWLSLLSGLGLLALAGARRAAIEPGPIERLVGWSCGLCTVLIVLSVLTFGPGLGELRAGAPVALAGALVGLFGLGSLASGAFADGASPTPIRPGRGAPPAAVAPPRATGPAPSAYELEQAQRQQAVAAGRASATGTAAIDAAHAALRFVAHAGTVTEEGLTIQDKRGTARTIAWAAIVEVRSRRLPPDPPYEKAQLVDLVIADGPPVRLMASSRVDWTTLPGGMGPSAKENWRRLVALVRARNPAVVIEADSAEFFAGGRDVPMFRSIKELIAYERAYG